MKLPTDEELKRLEDAVRASKKKREQSKKKQIEKERQDTLKKLTGGK